jgi:RNA polymerase sigma-70 factor (ECF subfamily)
MLKRGRVAPVSGDTEGDNSDARPPLRRFEEVYDEHVDFVRRSARWFGVLDAAAEDIVQQVFMVVHRRLPDLRRGSSPRTWLFGIVMRVVLQHRRSLRRKNPDGAGPHIDPETVADDESNGPHEWTARVEAARLVQRWMDDLDEDKRKLFVLAELEEMTGREIAEVLGENQNTIYSRLRMVRLDFEKTALRCRQHDARRTR